jgi:hypothetical protein
MKTTFTFVTALMLISCGQEKETILNYQDTPRCLSCDVNIPEQEPIPESNGSVKAAESDLMFFCTMGDSNCEQESIQSVLIYNLTQEESIVYVPTIGSYDTGGLPIYSSRFHVVQNQEYPFVLEPGHSLEVSVQFDWTTEVQFSTLIITVNEERLITNLTGKMFEPMGE